MAVGWLMSAILFYSCFRSVDACIYEYQTDASIYWMWSTKQRKEKNQQEPKITLIRDRIDNNKNYLNFEEKNLESEKKRKKTTAYYTSTMGSREAT